MSERRERMSNAMSPCGMAAPTQGAHIAAVADLAMFDHRSPAEPRVEEVQADLLHLIRDRKLACARVNQASCALRFLCRRVRGRPEAGFDIRMTKARERLRHILLRAEVARLIQSVRPLRGRTLLMTTDATGLRVSEVCHLQVGDVESAADRMCLKVRQGPETLASAVLPSGVHPAARTACADRSAPAGDLREALCCGIGHPRRVRRQSALAERDAGVLAGAAYLEAGPRAACACARPSRRRSADARRGMDVAEARLPLSGQGAVNGLSRRRWARPEARVSRWPKHSATKSSGGRAAGGFTRTIGWSTRNSRSAARSSCSKPSRATRIRRRSPMSVSSAWTRPRDACACARCRANACSGCRRGSSSSASCCTCYRAAASGFGTMGCSHRRRRRRGWRWRGRPYRCRHPIRWSRRRCRSSCGVSAAPSGRVVRTGARVDSCRRRCSRRCVRRRRWVPRFVARHESAQSAATGFH